MRSDGNLKEVYKGIKSKGRGRPKLYGAKIDLKQIDKRKWKKCYQTEEMTGYERIVYCVTLKQPVKVVYLQKVDITVKVYHRFSAKFTTRRELL